MKCPKCKFVVSDKKDACPKCGLNLKSSRQSLSLIKNGKKVTQANSSNQDSNKGGFLKSILGKSSAGNEVINDSSTNQAGQSQAGDAQTSTGLEHNASSPADGVAADPIEAISETLSSNNDDLQNFVNRAEEDAGSVLDQEIDDFELFILAAEQSEEPAPEPSEPTIEEIQETSISGIISQVENSTSNTEEPANDPNALENLNLLGETEDKIRQLESELTADSYLSLPTVSSDSNESNEKSIASKTDSSESFKVRDSLEEKVTEQAKVEKKGDADWKPLELAGESNFALADDYHIDLNLDSNKSAEIVEAIQQKDEVQAQEPLAPVQESSDSDFERLAAEALSESSSEPLASVEDTPSPEDLPEELVAQQNEQDSQAKVEEIQNDQVESEATNPESPIEELLSDEKIPELSEAESEGLAACPFVAPEVMEFGDGAENWEDQLDQMLGDESLDIESVAVEKTEQYAQPDLGNSFLLGDDMEVSIEFEVEGDYEDEEEFEEEEEETPVAASQPVQNKQQEPSVPKGENLLSGLVSAFEQIGSAPQRQSLTEKDEGAQFDMGTLGANPEKEIEEILSKAAIPGTTVSAVQNSKVDQRFDQELTTELEAKDRLIHQLSTLLAEAYGVSPQDILEDDPLLSLGQTLEDELAELMSMGNTFVQAEGDPLVDTLVDSESSTAAPDPLASLQQELDGELEGLIAEGMNVISAAGVEDLESQQVNIDQELKDLEQLSGKIEKEETSQEPGSNVEELSNELDTLNALEQAMHAPEEKLNTQTAESASGLEADLDSLLDDVAPLDMGSTTSSTIEDEAASKIPEPLKDSVDSLSESAGFLKNDIDKILEQAPLLGEEEAATVDFEQPEASVDSETDPVLSSAEISSAPESQNEEISGSSEALQAQAPTSPELMKTFDHLFDLNTLQGLEEESAQEESIAQPEAASESQEVFDGDSAEPSNEENGSYEMASEIFSEAEIQSPSHEGFSGEITAEESEVNSSNEGLLAGAELDHLISDVSGTNAGEADESAGPAASLLPSTSLEELIQEAAEEDHPQNWDIQEQPVEEIPQEIEQAETWDFSQAEEEVGNVSETVPNLDLAIDEAQLAELLGEQQEEQTIDSSSTEEENNLSEKKTPKIILR